MQTILIEQKCALHTPAAKNFDSTAFVPRAQLRIICPKGFYVIGALSYYITKVCFAYSCGQVL